MDTRAEEKVDTPPDEPPPRRPPLGDPPDELPDHARLIELQRNTVLKDDSFPTTLMDDVYALSRRGKAGDDRYLPSLFEDFSEALNPPCKVTECKLTGTDAPLAWTPKDQTAQSTAIVAIEESTGIHHPSGTRHLLIQTDAGEHSLGAYLFYPLEWVEGKCKRLSEERATSDDSRSEPEVGWNYKIRHFEISVGIPAGEPLGTAGKGCLITWNTEHCDWTFTLESRPDAGQRERYVIRRERLWSALKLTFRAGNYILVGSGPFRSLLSKKPSCRMIPRRASRSCKLIAWLTR